MADGRQAAGFDEHQDGHGRSDSCQVFSMSELPTAALRAIFSNATEDTEAVHPDGGTAELIQMSALRDARAEREAARHRRIGRRFI